MKRLLTSAAAAAVMVAWSGSGAEAQEARSSLFDLGIYGGAGYSANWLSDPDVNPGFAPVLGANATFWASDAIGVRTNLTYSWMDLPDEARPEKLNGWLYDLDLVLRPWFGRDDMSRLMSSMYLFLGGGAFTANPPGDGLACVEPYRSANGACLAVDWEKSTVGQGTFGLGWDLVSLSRNIGIFAELAGHVYDSPFHTGRGWTTAPTTGVQAEDTYGFTGRANAGIKFMFGERAPVVVPPPPPPPAPAPPPPPPAPTTREISVCVVEATGLRNVTATFTPATGDTTVAGQPFSQAYPATAPTYAAGATWFINSDSLRFADNDYVKFGVSRLITNVTQLTQVGTHEGTPIFAEAGGTSPYQVLYVPLRPGCEFQPYQLRTQLRPRG